MIVPCYNEEHRLDANKFLESSTMNPWLHFLFLNDGSTDKTAEILEALCRMNPAQMHHIPLERNVGKAEAVREGFLFAFPRNYERIGYWDADLATPLEMIPKFCDVMETTGKDIVMGARVRLLGRNVQRRAVRHYLGRVFATGASLVLGVPIYDTQCGAKLFRNNGKLQIVFRKPFRVKWTFDVELLARLIALERFMGGRRLKESSLEYPLDEWIDIPGSKLTMKDFFLGAWELMRIFHFLRWPGVQKRHAELMG